MLTRFWDFITVPQAAVQGVDWVLNAMAFISPQADYYPETARAVNTGAIQHVVRAIEAQPDGAKRIRLIHTGTVAETGDRPGGPMEADLLMEEGGERDWVLVDRRPLSADLDRLHTIIWDNTPSR